jgi:hypothetical protein
MEEIDGRVIDGGPPLAVRGLRACVSFLLCCASNLLRCFRTSSSLNFMVEVNSRNASEDDGSRDAGG